MTHSNNQFTDDGQCRDYRYGNFHAGQLAVHLCLFGDEAKMGPFVMDATCAQHPREAGYADVKMLSFKIQFPEIRKYQEVEDALYSTRDQFKEMAGFELVTAISGLPMTGSSVDGLKDTSMGIGCSAEQMDWEVAPCGFSAADGFSLTMEVLGTQPAWTESEVRQLVDLAEKIAAELSGTEIRLLPLQEL